MTIKTIEPFNDVAKEEISWLNIPSKSEIATLQYFCDKVLDQKYLLKLNNVSQTSSKGFVETPSICLLWCLSYVPFLYFKCYHEFCNRACTKKIILLTRIGHKKHTKTDLSQETSSEINFEFIKFVNCLPLTKTNGEFKCLVSFDLSWFSIIFFCQIS